MTGVLRAVRDRKLECPKDVQIVSSDDSEWLDVFQPSIVTIVQPSYSMRERGADLLLKRMKQPGRRFEQIVLAPDLNIRI